MPFLPPRPAALLAAALLAVYPPLVVYGARTLSEVPSALCLVASLVLVARTLAPSDEGGGRVAFAAGALGALGVVKTALRPDDHAHAGAGRVGAFRQRRGRIGDLRALVAKNQQPRRRQAGST